MQPLEQGVEFSFNGHANKCPKEYPSNTCKTVINTQFYMQKLPPLITLTMLKGYLLAFSFIYIYIYILHDINSL